MTVSSIIYEKSRNQERRYRAFFFLISKILLVCVFSNLYLNKSINKLINFNFDKDVFLSIVIIFISFFIVCFILDKLEESYINRANSDEKFRKKILGPKRFIEGEWFIATLEKGEVVEYALSKIWFNNNRLNLKGDLFKIDSNGVAYHFGYYKGLVGEFFDEQDKYIYAYERKSEIEKHHKSYAQLEGAYGKGEYIFDYKDGAHIGLSGAYFDPVSNNLRQLRGLRVTYMQRKYGLHQDIDLNTSSAVSKMHLIFLEINKGLRFRQEASSD